MEFSYALRGDREEKHHGTYCFVYGVQEFLRERNETSEVR